MSFDEKFTAIRKGLLEFLLLKIIAGAQVYAADILQQLDGTEFATQEGTLYPLLSKMRREGLLDYEWKESEAGPPRKYYRLTAKGREHLRVTADYWQTIITTVKNLGPRSGACHGKAFCEHCVDDRDCADGASCVEASGGQRACFKTPLDTKCTKDSDCPKSPSGKYGACLDETQNVTPDSSAYHYCYLPFNAPKSKFECWY